MAQWKKVVPRFSSRVKHASVIGLCQAVFLLSPRIARGAEPYSATELQREPQFVGYYTAQIDEDGRVPGYSRELSSPSLNPTVWKASGTAEYLTLPSNAISGYASAIAAAGEPVGAVRYSSNEETVPCIWSGSGLSELPLPDRFGWAGVAAGDWIVGGAITSDGVPEPAVWLNRQFIGIVHGLPGSNSFPSDINSKGKYVGVWSGLDDSGNYIYGGFVGSGLTVHVVSIPGWKQTPVYGINDADTTVGVYLPDGLSRIGYVAHDDHAQSLSPLPGGVESPVWAINNHDDMVGLSTDVFGNETATVYFAGSLEPTDMNTLVELSDLSPAGHNVRLVRGIDVNDAGQILVEGADFTDGVYRYYILTPVPEPATLASSCAFVALTCRRRARHA